MLHICYAIVFQFDSHLCDFPYFFSIFETFHSIHLGFRLRVRLRLVLGFALGLRLRVRAGFLNLGC